MNTEELEKAVTRLKRITTFDYKLAYQRKQSNRMCLREYLRRMYLWALYLGIDKRQWEARPIYDIQVPENESWLSIYADLYKILQKENILQSFGAQGRSSVLYFLHWHVTPVEERNPQNLPEPYEPFIIYLERGGGGLQMNNTRELEGGGGVRVRPRWDDFTSLPSIDIRDSVLNDIDAKI